MGVGSLFKIRKYAKQFNMKFLLVGLQIQVKKVLDTVQALPSDSVFKNIKELEIINPDKELKIPIILHYHQRSYYTQLQKEIIALLKSFFKENL